MFRRRCLSEQILNRCAATRSRSRLLKKSCFRTLLKQDGSGYIYSPRSLPLLLLLWRDGQNETFTVYYEAGEFLFQSYTRASFIIWHFLFSRSQGWKMLKVKSSFLLHYIVENKNSFKSFSRDNFSSKYSSVSYGHLNCHVVINFNHHSPLFCSSSISFHSCVFLNGREAHSS